MSAEKIKRKYFHELSSEELREIEAINREIYTKRVASDFERFNLTGPEYKDLQGRLVDILMQKMGFSTPAVQEKQPIAKVV